MKIVGIYSLNGGSEVIRKDYSIELEEIKQILLHVNAQEYQIEPTEVNSRTKRAMFDSRKIDMSIKNDFVRLGWKKQKIYGDSPSQYYVERYKPSVKPKQIIRKIDFTKNHLGIDIEFNKRSLPVYSGCAKMTIFRNLGIIRAGVEIVPVKELAHKMS